MSLDSSFKPIIIRNQPIDAKVRIIDPNPTGEIVPHEDLLIFVSLTAKQKSKSVLTETDNNGIEIKNLKANTLDLVVPHEKVNGSDLFTTKPYLSTDWTEIGGGGKSEVDFGADYESFGITNIDVEVKSATTPKVIIDFVDVRGATLFEQGSCSPYGLFFNLPYPTFELTLKGYYGRPVKYYLNLVKFNTKFNSDTGNMECRAEFIGYSFAFLSDMIVGYIMGSQYLKEGYTAKKTLQGKYEDSWKFYQDSGVAPRDQQNPFCNNPVAGGNCLTIMDLLKSIKNISDKDLPFVKGSPEWNDLTNLLGFQTYYKTYQEHIFKFFSDVAAAGGTILKPSEAYNGENGQQMQKIVFTQKPCPKGTAAQVGAAATNQSGCNQKLTSAIDLYFNKLTGQFKNDIVLLKTTKITDSTYGSEVEGVTLQTTATNTDFTSDDNTATDLIYNLIKTDVPFQNGALSEYGYSKWDEKVPALTDEEKAESFIDMGYILKTVNAEADAISLLVKTKKEAIVGQINDIIAARLGFKPTIRNIFTVILCNTDAFMSILLDVATKAELHHEGRKTEYLRTNGSSGGSRISSNDGKVYAWPTYYEKNYTPKGGGSQQQGTKEAFPGNNTNFLNWIEVKFVEDFIQAFLDLKKDQAILNDEKEGITGFDNYIPITTLESPISHNSNPMIYKDIEVFDGGGNNNLVKVIGERLFIALDHTNFQPMRLAGTNQQFLPYYKWNPFVSSVGTEVAQQMGIIDAWNLINGQENITFLQALNTALGNSSTEFIDKVKAELTKNGQLTRNVPVNLGIINAGTVATTKYKPTNGYIQLTGDNGAQEIVKIYPNPLDGNMNPTDLIQIITPEEAPDFGITITNEDFKAVVDQYKTSLSKVFGDIGTATNSSISDDFAITAKFGLDSDQDKGFQIPKFETKNLMITLNPRDLGSNSPNQHWTGGDPSGIAPSVLTYFTVIDDSGSIEAHPVSLKYGSGYIANSFVVLNGATTQTDSSASNTNILGFDTNPLYSPAIKNLDISGDIKDFTSPFQFVKYQTDLLSKLGPSLLGGTVDAFITTPSWLDNVNGFRKKVTNGWELPAINNDYGTRNSEQVQNRNLAYLFLNLLKPTPPIVRGMSSSYELKWATAEYKPGEQQYAADFFSIKNFNLTGGMTKAPKAWVLSLGAQLWRWRTFVGTTTDADGNKVWNKPIPNGTGSVAGILPTGFDPLAQPGFNSHHGDTYTKPDRNNIDKYMNKVYTNTGSWSTKIQKSVFGNDYKKTVKLYPNLGTGVSGENRLAFDYYGVYGNTGDFGNPNLVNKSKINRDDKNDYGLWPAGVNGTPTANRTAKESSIWYSWPTIWIAPHHIPYTHPTIFDNGSQWIKSDETYIVLDESRIGVMDYQTIMSQTRTNGSYNDGGDLTYDTTTETNRSRKKDGDLGYVLLNLPDAVKDIFVEKFETWANTEWPTLLKIVDPVNFGDTLNSTYKLYTDKKNDDKTKEVTDDYALTAMLLDNEGQGKNLVQKLLKDEYWIINSTPKIWFGIDKDKMSDQFMVSDSAFDEYLSNFYDTVRNKVSDRIKEIGGKTTKDEEGLADSAIDDDDIKLSLYRTFKSLTDKWISASSNGKLFFNITSNGSLGGKCGGLNAGESGNLAAHFQYVNRVMGDIGNDAVLDVTKLMELNNNIKITLYQYISDVLTENEYMFFPLPSYINYAQKGLNEEDLLDMFRPTMSLDKVSCGPLFLSMYVGGNSRQLNYTPKTNCKLDAIEVNFEDDSFSLSTPRNEIPTEFEQNKEGDNGFTAFKVVYGLENQNHFKNIQLDQSEFSETAESLLVIDKLSKQGGTDQATKGQNLNSIYLTRSYSCTIESFGNMMIQPLTYFDLFGVPMFNGTYLITEVKHNFKPNNASTTFKGVRQPRATIPIVTDAAIAMNLSLSSIEAKTGKSLSEVSNTAGVNTTTTSSAGSVARGNNGGATSPSGLNLYPDISKDILKLFGNPVLCANNPTVTGQVFRTSGDFHGGIDIGFGKPDGGNSTYTTSANVISAYDGVVTNAGAAGGFGTPDNGGWIIVRYGQNGGDTPFPDGNYYFYIYGHCNPASGIVVGSKVTKGQVIGKAVHPTNNKSQSTGLHLHLTVLQLTSKSYKCSSPNGRDCVGKIDPSPFLNQQESCIKNVYNPTPGGPGDSVIAGANGAVGDVGNQSASTLPGTEAYPPVGQKLNFIGKIS